MQKIMSKDFPPKPFVKWAGGKGNLLGQLELLLPDNFETQEDVTYIEPFVGGGAMMFYILSKFKNIKHVVINDINTDLINCYRIIRDNPTLLIKELKLLESEYSKLELTQKKVLYYDIRRKYNSRRTSELKLAAYFLFLNHTCFNGLYRVNSSSEFNVPCGKYLNPKICNEEVIIADHKLLNNLEIEILNGDYQCVNDYLPEHGNIFVYLDPPYMPISTTSYFKQYSASPFDEKEQQELEIFCKKLTANGCLFMLSNSDCKIEDGSSYFESLYSNFNTERIYARRYINAHTSKREKLSEIVIRNYRSKSPETLL